MAKVFRDLMVPRKERRHSEPYLATLAGGTQNRVGIVEGLNKLVLTRIGAQWKAELYRRPVKGMERRSDRPDVRDRLRDKLELFRDKLPRGKPELRQRLSDEEQLRLRALGYAEPIEKHTVGESEPE